MQNHPKISIMFVIGWTLFIFLENLDPKESVPPLRWKFNEISFFYQRLSRLKFTEAKQESGKG